MVSKISKNIVLDSCNDLYNYLRSGNVSNPFTLYSDKVILNRETFNHPNMENTRHSIRIWKSKTMLNYWYNDQSSSSFIGALDYQIRPNDILIEYLNVNDDECCYKTKPIDQTEAIAVQRELLEYVKNRAKEENKQKVIIDVHENLRLYNKYYKDEGFQVTERKSSDNPFWREAEITLPKEH